MSRQIVLCSLILLIAGFANPAPAEKNLVRPPGTTRYAAMVTRLQELARDDKYGRLTLGSIGRSVRGRTLWLITLHDKSVDIAHTRRVFYICRQHGHEPAGTEAALQFISDLVSADPGTPLADDLNRVTVYIVPMANPDGAEAFLRHNAHDVDLNRDWLARREPETRALYRAIEAMHPDIVADQHELYPTDSRGDLTEAAAPGSGADAKVVSVCESLQDRVRLALGEAGHVVTSHWVDDHRPARLAHRFWSVRAHIPAILFESARHEGSGRSVAERAALHRQFMGVVLGYLAEDGKGKPTVPPSTVPFPNNNPGATVPTPGQE